MQGMAASPSRHLPRRIMSAASEKSSPPRMSSRWRDGCSPFGLVVGMSYRFFTCLGGLPTFYLPSRIR